MIAVATGAKVMPQKVITTWAIRCQVPPVPLPSPVPGWSGWAAPARSSREA